ncbi:MAG: DUF4870 domain-containing protein [Sphingomonadales bacterium]|nr:DUF4870 domain-containing protein [Sphingomonadales bacterium]
MSLVAAFAGLPLPILNLLATFVFYIGNRRGTYFVRWHCMQALLSQLSLLFINSTGFWWTISLIFTDEPLTDSYLAYMLTAVICNIIEFIATIQAAIKTRRGEHVEWFLFGPLTHLLCKP